VFSPVTDTRPEDRSMLHLAISRAASLLVSLIVFVSLVAAARP
jgi:hypothetical protein